MSLGKRRRMLGIAYELNGFMDVEKTAVSQGFYEIANNVITLIPTIKSWTPIRPRFKKPIKLKQNDILSIKIVECDRPFYGELLVGKSDGAFLRIINNDVLEKGKNYSISILSDCEIVAMSLYTTASNVTQKNALLLSIFVNNIQVL